MREILIEDIKKLIGLANKNEKVKYLLKIEKFVLYLNDPELSLLFAIKVPGANIVEHGQIILDSKNIEYIFKFCEHFVGVSCGPINEADSIKYDQAIVKSKNIKYNYKWPRYYARYRKGIDIKAHGQVIIESGNPWLNFNYSLIEGADVKAHQQVILNSKNPKLIFSFATRHYLFGTFDKIDIKACSKKIIDSKDAEYNFLFVNFVISTKIQGIDISAHEQAIIESENPEWSYNYAQQVKGADIKAHEQVIKNSENSEYIYNFAHNVKGANKEDLLQELKLLYYSNKSLTKSRKC